MLAFFILHYSFFIPTASAQQRVVVAGLEGNAEYRALVAEEGTMVHKADSLSRRIGELRRAFRTISDSIDRAANSAAILRMEEEGFELRGRMARLAGRINAIEQQWILDNLNSTPEDAGETGVEGDDATERQPANLVRSAFFERYLSPGQLAELRDADEVEAVLPELTARYRENHARLRTFAADYARATTQPAADSVKERFDAMAAENRQTDEQIGRMWEVIFDSKSYIYNLLAEKRGFTGILDGWARDLAKLRDAELELRGRYASDAISEYTLQKSFMVTYEESFAEAIGNPAARDSLRRVNASLPGDLYTLELSLAWLEPVRLRERSFLEYADVKIGSSPYNARNPVPEVKVWPQGVMYRVLLGNFSAAQTLPIFRNAWPLAFQKTPEGRWRYFAGGFSSESAAQAAVTKLSKAGFRNPAVVVWVDGVYIDPTASGEDKAYCVELSGIEELPSGATEAIGENEIIRVEKGFIISPLDALTAIRLRTTLGDMEGLHPDLTVKLHKISE